MADLLDDEKPRQTATVAPEMNVTPLVDVVLVLLIIFMVVTPQMESGANLELPVMSHPDKAELESDVQPTVLSLAKDGSLYFDKAPVAKLDLEQKLVSFHQDKPDARLVLKADREAQYGDVRALFKLCQTIGFPRRVAAGHRPGEPATVGRGELTAMAFDVGGSKSGQVRPTMNVTPLVDVVLVLLIIFMVVTPLLTKQVWLNVPPKPKDEAAAPPPDAQPPLVLTVDLQGRTRVNFEEIPKDELVDRLKRMLNARADKVVFFDADSKLPYEQAVAVLDLVKGGGVETVAVLADELPANP